MTRVYDIGAEVEGAHIHSYMPVHLATGVDKGAMLGLDHPSHAKFSRAGVQANNHLCMVVPITNYATDKNLKANKSCRTQKQ